MTDGRRIFVFFGIFHYFTNWEDENYANHNFTNNSRCVMDCCYAVDPDYHRIDDMTGKEYKNEKLNITPKDILNVLLAAAATILCIIIDVVAKENNKDSENQKEGEE